MENLKADDQETSTSKTISISVGIECNYNENSFEKLSCNMVPPCPVPFGRSSFAEAKKRLKKLERDYQHTYEKYTELQSDSWYRYQTELRNSKRNIYWAGYCSVHIKNVVEQLQIFLDNLNKEEAPQRRRETSSSGKQFFLKHGCKSLAQENLILELKEKNEEQDSDDLSDQETIDVKRIDKTLSYIQRIIPESINKKPLLRRVKDIKKLTEKSISNGERVGNLRSHQDNMKKCTSIKIKLLTKAIRDFEKERDETENILQRKTRTEKGYLEEMKVLKEKCDCIGEKRDAEKKYILDLKKKFRSKHKTASPSKGC